ncbi:MAG: hypothetical protein K0R66_1166 [Gammaproteobacteria bacterium]|jgi:uncharacterized protein YaaR (DUF327 family)|nr:hypothetical protein [Gammaproteobacteria bacterium]
MNAQELDAIKACLTARKPPEIKILVEEGKIRAYVEEASDAVEKAIRIKAVLSTQCVDAIKEIKNIIKAYVEEAADEAEKASRIKAVLSSMCSDAIKKIKSVIKAYVEEAADEAEKASQIKNVLSSMCPDVIKEIKDAVKVYVEEAPEDEKATRITAVLSSHCADAIKKINSEIKVYVESVPEAEKGNRIKEILSSRCSNAIEILVNTDVINWYLTSAEPAEVLERLKRVICSHIKQNKILAIVPPIIVEKNIVIEGLTVAYRYSSRLEKLIQEVNKLKAQAAQLGIGEVLAGSQGAAGPAQSSASGEYSVAALFGSEPINFSALAKVTGKKRKKAELDETESATEESSSKKQAVEAEASV